ncbi:MAG: oligosaccharide flippase family protein [Phycisphaerales bacterium]
MTAAGMTARVSSLVTQAIVAFFLTKEQIGVYATAQGVLGITAIMRAGGVFTYLPTMQPEEFSREGRRLFAWAATCLFTGGAITAVSAQFASTHYQQPILATVLYILAVRNAASAFSIFARARMVVHLRFSELAKLDMTVAVLKPILVTVVAWNLSGTYYAPLTMVVPFCFGTLADIVWCVPRSGLSWKELRPDFGRLWETAYELRWSLTLALLISLGSDVSLAIISFFAQATVVGVFYFAYQLSMQPLNMFSNAFSSVMAPTVARERGDRARENEVLNRVFSGAMLFAPLITFGAAAVFPAVEELIYRGRWAAASLPLTFLSVGFCFVVVCGLMTGPLLGMRRFRKLAAFEGMRASGVIGGSLLGLAVIHLFNVNKEGAAAPAIVAAGAGFFLALLASTQVWMIMRDCAMNRLEILRNLLFGPSLAGLCAVASVSLGNSIMNSLPPGMLGGTAADALRLVLVTGSYGLIALAALRFVAEGTLRRTIEVLPPKAAKVLNRALAF